jgi:hypothetical protein
MSADETKMNELVGKMVGDMGAACLLRSSSWATGWVFTKQWMAPDR